MVITGTGCGFIAGADVNEYDRVSQEKFDEYQWVSREVFETLERLPQPTIAAVNGYAFGGGFELAMCCDFIIASRRHGSRFPRSNWGSFQEEGAPNGWPARWVPVSQRRSS